MSQTCAITDLPIVQEGNVKVARLVDPMFVGDCIMEGGAQVTFSQDVRALFHARVRTSGSVLGDTWHQRFFVKSRSGRELFRFGFDRDLGDGGPDRDFDGSFSFNPDFFDLLIHVDWQGEC
jgi:hypothetical protein